MSKRVDRYEQADCDRVVVAYCRVSSREQAEGYSIEAQLRLCRDLVAKENLKLAHDPFVEVHSAKEEGRPVFREMTSFLKKNTRVGGIVAHLAGNDIIDQIGARQLGAQQGCVYLAIRFAKGSKRDVGRTPRREPRREDRAEHERSEDRRGEPRPLPARRWHAGFSDSDSCRARRRRGCPRDRAR